MCDGRVREVNRGEPDAPFSEVLKAKEVELLPITDTVVNPDHPVEEHDDETVNHDAAIVTRKRTTQHTVVHFRLAEERPATPDPSIVALQ